MRPIPLSLLPDTAIVEEPDNEADSANAYLSPVTILHVRLDDDVTAIDKAWANDEEVTGVLFIDAVNSAGAFCPSNRSRVTVGDVTGFVRSSKTRRAFGPGVHHWEVAIGG